MSLKTYRTFVLLLWAVVSLVTGLSIGSFFDLSGRQLLFPVAGLLGVFLLVVVRVYGRYNTEAALAVRGGDQSVQVNGAVDARPSSHRSEARQATALLPSADASVQDLMEGSGTLSKEEVREWLDSLLIRQQRRK